MRILVVGASGYVGGRLGRAAAGPGACAFASPAAIREAWPSASRKPRSRASTCSTRRHCRRRSRASSWPTTWRTPWPVARPGFERARPCRCPRLRALRARGWRGSHRLPGRAGRPVQRALPAPHQSPAGRGGTGRPWRAGHRVPGCHHHRLGQRLLRAAAQPRGAPAGDDHAALGADALSAHRHPRRARLSSSGRPAIPSAPASSRSAGRTCSPTPR